MDFIGGVVVAPLWSPLFGAGYLPFCLVEPTKRFALSRGLLGSRLRLSGGPPGGLSPFKADFFSPPVPRGCFGWCEAPTGACEGEAALPGLCAQGKGAGRGALAFCGIRFLLCAGRVALAF